MSAPSTPPVTAVEALSRAQEIAFAPMVFQASYAMRKLGILAAIDGSGGLTLDDVARRTKVPVYGVRVLLEAGLGIGVLARDDGRYSLTETGWFLLHDRMTSVNLDFVQDVCYQGLFTLESAIASGSPTGLSVFGKWPTVYQALAHLDPAVQRSWFAFDHFYSDDAYAHILPILRRYAPRRMLDIGSNTGRFALLYLQAEPAAHVGILDLPGVMEIARTAIAEHGLTDRVSFHAADILDPSQSLPRGFDGVWMSQFLDCFSEAQIVDILRKVVAAIDSTATVFIMEPFWDRQRHQAGAFCLQMTSLYFTSIANGNSQLYESATFLRLVEQAGLRVEEQIDELGICQSLLVCRKV